MVIDPEGFRLNVGIVLLNEQAQLFWAKRINQNSWQFPQGGILPKETAEQAMYRELYEELGLKDWQVQLRATTRHWLRYRIPDRFLRGRSRKCIGQKQKWFLISLAAEEHEINLNVSTHPEFDDWKWVSFWYPLRQIITFKKNVYRQVLKEFLPTLPSISRI